MAALLRQHLIDPEVCIRCNTCEDTCPIGAITHDDNNYVVKADVCGFCMDCIAPCPTGAIDSWRIVAEPYSLEEQFSWDELPEQAEVPEGAEVLEGAAAQVDDEASELLERAHAGAGGRAVAPASASQPYVNLFSRDAPAVAKVTGNYRLTGEDSESDIHHIVLDFGNQAFPVLEGQSIGIIPPGVDAKGRPHLVRLYSVASSRDGERPNHNNVALTIKRVDFEVDGERGFGLGSDYMCSLKKGDEVQVTGPFGNTFLMPNDPDAHLVMICTGTGSAPFRAMTERRRRLGARGGKLLLFFGARTPQELPYHGPLLRLPKELIDVELAYSRLPDRPKEYVQDRMRLRAEDLATLLRDGKTYIYICGLKGMEEGVNEALADICRHHGMDWSELRPQLRAEGRYHVETY